MGDPERLSTSRMFDGKVFDVDRDRVRMPNGREVTVDVNRHAPSAVIAPVPDPIVRVGSMFPTPGYCDEEMFFFRVSGLSVPEEAAALDEDEDIEVRTF